VSYHGPMRGAFHKPTWVEGRPPTWLLLAAATLALFVASVAYVATHWPAAGRSVAHFAPTAQQVARQECIEGVMLYHDVQWAEACARLEASGETDGHADCELPETEAERLNRLLQWDERSCRTDAARSRR
jgi:hypothetical protein